MKNIKLTISYDGTGYHGWQRQENATSIQEVIEKACKKLFKQEVILKSAGRTDAGVHALEQCATFRVDTPIPVNRIPIVLNTVLPDDIVIIDAEEVSFRFHPQYCAKSKTYSYTIMNRRHPIPQMRNYTYFVYEPLNVELMNKAASHFIGTHDFSSFCAIRSNKENKERTIYDSSVTQEGEIIKFEIRGNGFLYNMVRIMMGTLIQVGKGIKEADSIKQIILSKDRKQAGETAPAHGLTMSHIEY